LAVSEAVLELVRMIPMERIVADHITTNPKVERVLIIGIHRAPQI
jgi:hypothetical protein